VTSSTHEADGASRRLERPIANRIRSREQNSDHLAEVGRRGVMGGGTPGATHGAGGSAKMGGGR
jgi:hypothetical protein